jgi:hypothetical protein
MGMPLRREGHYPSGDPKFEQGRAIWWLRLNLGNLVAPPEFGQFGPFGPFGQFGQFGPFGGSA